MANTIPKEIWVKIWSLVDFRTLQKSCTLVCKYWFGGIRGSTSLSGKMAVNDWQKSLEDINLILENWEANNCPNVTQMSCEMSDSDLLQLATHPSLKKIYFQQEYELGIWGKVTDVCFDLKTKSPATSIENVVRLHFLNFFEKWNWRDYDDEVHEPVLKRFKTEDVFSMEPIARTMLNLETLQIFDDSHDYVQDLQDKLKYFEPFFHGIQHCQNLTELILGVDIGEYAAFTPNIKTLFITGQLQLHLEDLDWIANLKKLESLTLDMLRFGDKKIDIKVFTTECKDMIRLSGLLLPFFLSKKLETLKFPQYSIDGNIV